MSYYFIKQHDQSDCGAACLTMILGNIGCKLSLSKLRQEIKTDINGSTIYGIVQTAESYGLKAQVLCGSLDEFKNEIENNNISFPVMANVLSADGYSHFIVLYKYKKGKIYIADPATRTYSIRLSDLNEVWIGNIISFSECCNVKKRNDTSHKMDKYLKICQRQKKYIAMVILISLLVAVIGTIGALIFEYVVDGIYNNNFLQSEYVVNIDVESASVDKLILNVITRAFPTLGKICTAIIVLYLFQGIMSYIQTYLLATMSKKINEPVMMSFFEHVIHVPLDFYAGRRTGDILSRFNDASGICQKISDIILNIFINGTLAAFYGVFLFGISMRLFSIVVISCLVYFIIICIFKKHIKNNQLEVLGQNAEVSSNLKESIEGIKTIKVYRMEEVISKKFYSVFSRMIKKSFDGIILESKQIQLVSFFSSVSVILILWVGVRLCMIGLLEVSSLITFYVMMGSFISPVKELISLQPQIQSVLVSAERLNDVFDIEKESLCDYENKSCESIKTLSLNNITFSYGYNLPVLENTSFEIKKGERVAVQGKNGCGKTTLANILMGLYKADNVDISVNNNKISYEEFCTYTSRIAYIPQESFFFSDTIFDNLIYGNNGVSEEDMDMVINLCCLSEYISSLPQGIYTRLEENGTNLSAGTKQKLAIARALLRKPEIFILDESTSNIDLESECEIERMFEMMGKSITIIDISHKIRNYDHYDKVYVLKNQKLFLKESDTSDCKEIKRN